MHLTLVVGDCPPVTDPAAEMPALPLLTQVLRHADRCALDEGWRFALARRHAPTSALSLSAAAIAAAAVPAAAGPVWFATPVHLLATPDHLRLPTGGLLVLDDADADALAADFSRVFAGSGVALHPARGRFLISGLAADAPEDAGVEDPADRLGSRLDLLARGSAMRRRLASEIELWLHSQAVNAARSGAGRPSIDALWLWGAAAPGVQATGRDSNDGAPAFFGEDIFIDGLAVLAGTVARRAPSSGDAIPAAQGTTVVQISLSVEAGKRPRTLASIEEDWLRPCMERLERGDLASFELIVAGVGSRITRRGLRRFWRRRRAWWEYLRR